MSRGVQRWAPLSGLVFLVLMVVGFSVAGNSPDPDASNAKIASYLAKDSSYHKDVASYFILLAAIVALVWFFSVLRSRISDVEGTPGRLGALALGAGVASAVFLFIGISLFIAPSIAAHDAHKNALDPGIYRFTQDLGYMIWVASAVIGALVVWATSAAALKAGLLPRWYGWLSLVIGIACLFAFFFFPILLYGLWLGVTGIVLTVHSTPAGTPSVAAPATAT